MKPITKKWLERANYDLKTAEAMYESRRYLYVAFMCQQAIEKLLKGIIHERKDIIPPYSHRLVALWEIANVKSPSKNWPDLLDRLTAFYINARYPEYKQKLSKGLNKNKAGMILNETQECFQWLKKELGT